LWQLCHFLSWTLTSFCHRYCLSHPSMWAHNLLKLMTNICENSMKNCNLYSLKQFLLYMQVLLHKHAKSKCILISTCTQNHIKLGPATFVTQELYATTAKRTTHLKHKENFQSTCTKNLQKARKYIIGKWFKN
jgi:hypothetical protein